MYVFFMVVCRFVFLLFLIILYFLVFKIFYELLECVEFWYFLVRKWLRRNVGFFIVDDELDNKLIIVRLLGVVVLVLLSDWDVCFVGFCNYMGCKGIFLIVSILFLIYLGLNLCLCCYFCC